MAHVGISQTETPRHGDVFLLLNNYNTPPRQICRAHLSCDSLPAGWETRGDFSGDFQQGSLHYTPEHCLVNGGVPLFWWRKPCFKWAKCICEVVMRHLCMVDSCHFMCGHLAQFHIPPPTGWALHMLALDAICIARARSL